MTTDVPPYRVPTMAEIRAVPHNGLTVISTFSGSGGSSLGYRMAGYKVLLANEFVPAAAETYRANAAPYTKISTDDIRDISGHDLLDMAGVKKIDLLDGSPPCASFSTSGKGAKSWGQVKSYSETQQRTDDLFFEFVRILSDIKPRAFVAENVTGLVRGSAKGYFFAILAAMRAAGYRVSARVLDASWLDVPQSRRRLIFVGVREDLNLEPVHPTPLPYQRTLSEAMISVHGHDFLAAALHNTSGQHTRKILRPNYDPSPTITIGVDAMNSQHYQLATKVGDPTWREDGFAYDPETGTRIDITSASVYETWRNMERNGLIYPGVLPNGKRTLFNMTRAVGDSPSPTILASHGNVAMAGTTLAHLPRRFTLAELRAVCGFPQDFELTGNYKQRWERLGRAVPPPMMKSIASTIAERVLCAD